MACATTKYRPTKLRDLVGQPQVTGPVGAWLARSDRESTVFLAIGPPGLGKSSLAYAIAGELGVTTGEYGYNWYSAEAGECDQEAMESIRDAMRFAPLGGPDDWRIVLIEEADLMTPKAQAMALGILENVGTRTVFVLTSNNVEWFRRNGGRIMQRCEVLEYQSDPARLRAEAQALAVSIWEAETGSADGAPSVDSLAWVGPDGHGSLRLVAKLVNALARGESVPAPVSVSAVSHSVQSFGRGLTPGQSVRVESVTPGQIVHPSLRTNPSGSTVRDRIEIPESLSHLSGPKRLRAWLWSLPAGSEVPSIRAMERQFLVARNTVRSAIKERFGSVSAE